MNKLDDLTIKLIITSLIIGIPSLLIKNLDIALRLKIFSTIFGIFAIITFILYLVELELRKELDLEMGYKTER